MLGVVRGYCGGFLGGCEWADDRVHAIDIDQMRVCYIAHPVGGDVKGNIEKIIAIVRHINLTEPDVVPFVPYLADLYALSDDDPAERSRGIRNDVELLGRGFIDEVRLYGDRISNGMWGEMKLAAQFDIPIVPVTDGVRQSLMERGDWGAWLLSSEE